MSTLLVGTAVVYSMDGRTVAFSGVATTENELSGSLSLADSFDKVDIKGAGGRVISRGSGNRTHAITLEVLWKDVGGSPTRASVDAKTKLPGKFGIVTLAGFNNTLYDGDWNYEGSTTVDAAEGARKTTLQLSRMEKADGTMGIMSTVAAS